MWHARAHLVEPENGPAMRLVRRRLVLAQTLYAVSALLTFADPVAAIVALAAVQVFFIVSPRIPVAW